MIIFFHPISSSIIIKPNNPNFFTLRSNCIKQKLKNPVQISALIKVDSCCCIQKNKGLFFKYNCRIQSGVKMEFWKKLGIGCFLNNKKENNNNNNVQQIGKNVEIEAVEGGHDVVDSAMVEAKLSPQHLVVMVNGLIGSSTDWKFAADQFVKQLPEKVMVHCSERNTASLTFDGVDLMGERLADEVSTVISHRPELQKISFIAHSLGGLVARYAIGKLYEPLDSSDHLVAKENYSDEDNTSVKIEKVGELSTGKIAGLEPMNFITVATPHLGSRGHRQLPFLCGVLFLEKQASQTAHLIAGRSGKHLFLTDTDEVLLCTHSSGVLPIPMLTLIM